ncbi:hypothetical protein [Pseudoalteromonas denitrificans]|nr:hypothetical protein [Pseudoalteromonas denitrificans]
MYKLIILVVAFLFTISSCADEILWRVDKNAFAFCNQAKRSTCFVIVNNTSTDVSLIENKNVGKLGVTSKEKYNRIVTFPSKWQRTDDNGDLIIFTTQAWLNGQRYTTSGMVFVDKQGKYVHQ